MAEKYLGKIASVSFGYQEYMFGLHFTLSGDGWGVCASYQYNPTYMNESEEHHSIEMLEKVQRILKAAKVDRIEDLKNKPIEATFEGTLLKDFRILTEVL